VKPRRKAPTTSLRRRDNRETGNQRKSADCGGNGPFKGKPCGYPHRLQSFGKKRKGKGQYACIGRKGGGEEKESSIRLKSPVYLGGKPTCPSLDLMGRKGGGLKKMKGGRPAKVGGGGEKSIKIWIQEAG